jgi:hypothetical protein
MSADSKSNQMSTAIALQDPSLWHWWRTDQGARREILSLMAMTVRLLAHVRQCALSRHRWQILLPVSSDRGHLEAIFSYLDGISLCAASSVCRRWREVEQEGTELWEDLCLNTFNVSVGSLYSADTGSDSEEEEEDRAKLLYQKMWQSSRLVLRTNDAVSGLRGMTVNKHLMNFM